MEESILIRFLNGDCDQVEERMILHWLESPGAKKQLDKVLQKKWDQPSPVFKDQTDYSALLERIHNRVKAQNGKPKWIELFNQGAKIAASISLLVFSAYFLYEGFRYENPLTSTDPIVQTITRVTGPGEKLTLNMPDHTKIIVNALSEISFNSAYGKDDRVIHLKGEAFFDIAPDAEKPFRVLTDSLTTTALGTAFNVYARGHKYEVALTEGSVKLDAFNKEVDLVPGQMALWDSKKQDPYFFVQKFNTERMLNWKEGILRFERKPLKDILNDLAAWYGVEMDIDKAVDVDRKVIGSFKNKNLKDILTGLGFSTGFDFDIKGKHVLIKSSRL